MSRLVGIAGIYDIARDVGSALFVQQYGGIHSCGVYTKDNHGVVYGRKDTGLISHKISSSDFDLLSGCLGIGHISSLDNDVQPYEVINQKLGETIIVCGDCTKDLFEKMCSCLEHAKGKLVTVLYNWMKKNFGPFAFLVLSGNKIYALRGDGRKPLCFGSLEENKGFIIASQQNAINSIGGNLIKHIEPGEIIVFDNTEYDSNIVVAIKRCIREIIFGQSPASRWGKSEIQGLRIRMGEALGRRIKQNVDIIYPVPYGGNAYAQGVYREISNRYKSKEENKIVTYNPGGFTKNFYPRLPGMRLNTFLSLTNEEEVCGRKIVIVNDTLRSGEEILYLVQRCRQAKAQEIHIGVACLQLFNCPYGGEIPAVLMGVEKTYSEIAKALNADTFCALTMSMICRAINVPEYIFCAECLRNHKPLAVG